MKMNKKIALLMSPLLLLGFMAVVLTITTQKGGGVFDIRNRASAPGDPTPTPILACIPYPECYWNPPIDPGGNPVPCSPPNPGAQGYCPRPTPALKIHVKLAGVTDGSAEGAKIALKLVTRDGQELDLPVQVALAHIGSGVYEAKTENPNILDAYRRINSPFTLRIKGEKHGTVKFCRSSGQTTRCNDTTFMNGRRINDPPNDGSIQYNYDFTGIPLPPGDVSPQDGVINAADFAAIKALMNKIGSDLTVADKLKGDLDYSGDIGVRDIFLIRQTLETRYDE